MKLIIPCGRIVQNLVRLALAVVILFVALPQFAWSGPKVIIPEATFNFGKVPQNVRISKTYWVKSVGDDTLRILTLIPGCGCTQIPLEDSVLAPGDSCSFEVKFNTGSYRGYVTKKPYLTTNAGTENVYVEFNAEIIVDSNQFRPVRMNPYKLDVSQFTVEPRRKASSWVVNTTENDLLLNMIDDKNKKFTAELPKVIKAHDSAQVTITVNQRDIAQEFEQSITFGVSDELGSRFTLPIQRIYHVPQETANKPK